jgi:hypothetical protein
MAARLFRCLMVAILSRSRSEQHLYNGKRDWKLPCIRRTEGERTGYSLQMGSGMRSGWRRSGQYPVGKDSIKVLFTTMDSVRVWIHETNIAA